jgi:hypothetical protein
MEICFAGQTNERVSIPKTKTGFNLTFIALCENIPREGSKSVSVCEGEIR